MHLPILFTLIPAILSSPFQSPMSPSTPTIYFAYGSNLWLHQMHLRCPSSQYIGLARLPGYKWLITTRGYANVVESKNASSEGEEDEVWGMVYTLSPADESQLDKNEGVPVAYTKEYLPCEFWHANSPHTKIDVTRSMTDRRDMLIYVDRQRTSPGTPREEYIYRMNRGIEDAVGCGVPGAYVEGVVRGYIPEDEGGEGKGGVEELARGQARGFRDESGVMCVDGEKREGKEDKV